MAAIEKKRILLAEEETRKFFLLMAIHLDLVHLLQATYLATTAPNTAACDFAGTTAWHGLKLLRPCLPFTGRVHLSVVQVSEICSCRTWAKRLRFKLPVRRMARSVGDLLRRCYNVQQGAGTIPVVDLCVYARIDGC